MVVLVRIVGMLLMLVGVVCLLNPEYLKRMIVFFIKGKRVYWSIGVKTIFGVVFLLAALQCRVPLVIAILGILLVSSLAVSLVIGTKGLKSMCEFWMERPSAVVRVWAALTLVMGVLIIVSA